MVSIENEKIQPINRQIAGRNILTILKWSVLGSRTIRDTRETRERHEIERDSIGVLVSVPYLLLTAGSSNHAMIPS